MYHTGWRLLLDRHQPGVNTSKTVSRQEVQWSDINGDGYPDYLVSKRDDELRVRYNQTKRTNLLKRVSARLAPLSPWIMRVPAIPMNSRKADGY